MISMPEMADSREDRGEAEAVGGGNDVVVLHGTTGLDDGGCAGSGDGFKSVREWEEGIGCGDGALKREDRFLRSELRGVDTAHLAGAYANGLAVAGVDDGIGFDVLADAPGEDEGAEFFRRGRTPRNNFELVFCYAAGVCVLQKQTS
jgi:hypothetical protein